MLAVLSSLMFATLAQVKPAEVPWFVGNLQEAYQSAAERDCLVAVHLMPDWSEWSQKQRHDAFADARVLEAMQAFVCIEIDPQDLTGEQLVQNCGVRTFPAVLFLDAAGKAEDTVAGYVPPRAYQRELQRIARGEGTVRGLLAHLEMKPMDLKARHQLAQKQWDLGDDAGYQAAMDFIRANDPEGKSVPMRRITLWSHQEDIFGCRSKGEEVHLEPLLAFLEEEKHATIRFEGYTYLAGVYLQLGEPKQARDAYRQAAKHVLETELPSWGSAVASVFANQAQELTNSERSFALKMARRAASAAERLDEDIMIRVACELIAAQCFEMQGKREEAAKHLQRAEAIAPDDASLQEELQAMKQQILGKG